jgi:hypothetical protein
MVPFVIASEPAWRATKQSSWIVTARFAHLATTKGMPLRTSFDRFSIS